MLKKTMPCHYIRPFLDRHGNCFPCCFKNSDCNFNIGNVKDKNLLEKFENFFVECECGFGKFRKKEEGDAFRTIHIQTSLRCHGKCAVCYVGAPQKKENIELNYNDAFDFLKKSKPLQIFLEGGEVPIQKNAMIFAEKIKNELEMKYFHLLTNGCYNGDIAKKIVSIFQGITVSYMGFDPSTYLTETGLDVETTKKFTKMVSDNGLSVGLRYIITPLSIKECGEFFKYAIQFKRAYVTMADCDISNYINLHTGLNYWQQIIRRCQVDFREALLTSRKIIEDNQCNVVIEPRTAKLLQIDQKTLDRFSLGRVKLF